MRDTMEHGGPNDAGTFIFVDRGLAFGHGRLSIIALMPGGHQPLSYDGCRYTITSNGEIYSFREIRAELERKGHAFRTPSDTELILASFQEWGTGCVTRFRGRWAFALWDEQERRLILLSRRGTA